VHHPARGTGGEEDGRVEVDGEHVAIGREAQLDCRRGLEDARVHDVTNEAAWDAVAAWALESHGRVDVLVNNAGVFEPALAVELSLASYRRVLAVNLDAPIFLATRAARGMIDRGYGRIVNITSIHGRFGEELALSYDAAKGGLDQATRTLAIELSRHGVLVNAVAPGFVSTRMSVVGGVNELDSEWFNDVYLRYGKLPMRR